MFCRRELPRYMEPARFAVRDALAVLPNGKPDLAALRASSDADRCCHATAAASREE